MASDGTFGFDELLSILDKKRFKAAAAVSFRKANNRIGLVFVRDARKLITVDKIYLPNSPATIALKGSSTPLIDTGDLVGAITYEVKSPFLVRLGVNSPKLSSGRYLYEVLHNGATIRRGGSVWIIPARPFLSTVWEDPDFTKEVARHYLTALAEALGESL